METPKTRAGRLTEDIMTAWAVRLAKRGEPRVSTGTYNAAYEAVLEVLTRELPEAVKRA